MCPKKVHCAVMWRGKKCKNIYIYKSYKISSNLKNKFPKKVSIPDAYQI